MSYHQHTFVDPSSLSHSSPSPSSPSPAPEPSSSSSNPRKRSRTETTSEERKEARAHRNRIAAQNSRDRRKAQFGYLERRVAELEEENRALRAGMSNAPFIAAVSSLSQPRAEEERKRQERDRENEELRERIKTLERGWDAVLKALAAQGLPLNHTATTTPTPQNFPPSIPTPTTTPPPSISAFPISPAPTHSTLDFAPSPVPSEPESEQKQEATRHLARVATIAVLTPLPMSLQRAPVQATPTAAPLAPVLDDEAAMENLFREILASPSQTTLLLPAAQDPPAGAGATQVALPSTITVEAGTGAGAAVAVGEMGQWGDDLEMKQILAEIGVGEDFAGASYENQEQGYELSELDMEMGWEMAGIDMSTFTNGQGVGVF